MNRKLLCLIFAGVTVLALAAREPAPTGQPLPAQARTAGASVGGLTSPKGAEIQCHLPGNLHRKNTASKGLGLCVFTSIHHSAVLQNVPQLQEFPRWLIERGIPGGGYPEKVAKLIPEISRARGLPEPDWIQVEGLDLDLLRLACKTGRMPGVTYSVSPTGRYGGQRIAHMVSLAHATETEFAVLDNNYIGEEAYEWLSAEEFRRTYAPQGKGWTIILLSPGAPPPPRNR